MPLVVDSPHSGRHYPQDFNHSVDRQLLRTAEDAFVDELCADVCLFGASLLAALFPRAYIDPNREEDDIDPAFVEGEYSGSLNPGPKSTYGIGLVRQKLASGDLIYDRRLTEEEFRHRIDTYHRPYHRTLSQLLDESVQQAGCVWHLNMHSMASVSNAVTPDKDGQRAYDIVLGDLDGRSCDPALTQLIADGFRDAGLRVRVNDPYKGAYITRRYGDPSANRHTLQIEMNRALYLDETRVEKHAGFNELKQTVGRVIRQLARWLKD